MRGNPLTSTFAPRDGKLEGIGRFLVTGGTGMLGGALTRELCGQGHDVVAGFLANGARALQVGRETGCVLWKGDVSDEEEVEKIFESFAFDGVVHLAGQSRNALLSHTSASQWEQTLRSYLDSSFLMCRAALQYLPSTGHLLLVSSRVGLRGNVGQCAYAAAKAGVFGLMKSAATEGRERGVRVNALCPGFVPTSSGALSPRQQELRAKENLLTENDAAQSFAAFTSWFLDSNFPVSGQVLRPDCRI